MAWIGVDLEKAREGTHVKLGCEVFKITFIRWIGEEGVFQLSLERLTGYSESNKTVLGKFYRFGTVQQDIDGKLSPIVEMSDRDLSELEPQKSKVVKAENKLEIRKRRYPYWWLVAGRP